MSIYKREVLDPIADALNGNVLQIPTHLERVNDIISIRPSIYTLIGGNTGSGKTSLVDDMYILKPYAAWHKTKHETDITFRGMYRSMERKRSLKLIKWACWRLFNEHGILIDSATLLGQKKGVVTQEVWDRLTEARDWADEMLDYVDIIDGRTTPSQYKAWLDRHAIKNGLLLVATNEFLYDASAMATPLDSFAAGKTQKQENGDIVPVVCVVVGNEEVVMKAGETRYFPNKPKEITVVVADHLGKFQGENGLNSRKAVVDKVSEVNCDIRDIYGYSPVAISQFNRAIGDVQRLKFADGDLSPQLEDFKESGNSQEDADLVIALFNPFRYKAYDENGMFRGYAIRDRMVNQFGYNRYRDFTILKNSYGVDDVNFGVLFRGEVNDFVTLPKAPPKGAFDPALEQVYLDIQNGK